MKLLEIYLEKSNEDENIFTVLPIFAIYMATIVYPLFIDGISGTLKAFQISVTMAILAGIAGVILYKFTKSKLSGLFFFWSAMSFFIILMMFWVPLMVISIFTASWFVGLMCNNGKIKGDFFGTKTGLFLPIISLGVASAIHNMAYTADFVIYWFIGALLASVVYNLMPKEDTVVEVS